MPNVNISETETTKLLWINQEKRRQPLWLKKNVGHGCTGKRRRGRPRLRWLDNTWEDMEKYEMTDGMTENVQYWKMMVNTGTQRCGDGL